MGTYDSFNPDMLTKMEMFFENFKEDDFRVNPRAFERFMEMAELAQVFAKNNGATIRPHRIDKMTLSECVEVVFKGKLKIRDTMSLVDVCDACDQVSIYLNYEEDSVVIAFEILHYYDLKTK